MNKLVERKELNVNDLIKGLTESQTVMNYAFAGFKTEVEQKFDAVNGKIDVHDELLKKKIYISSNEARHIRNAVKMRVRVICEENDLDYHEYKSRIFPRIYKAINDIRSVVTYRELPAFYYNDIMEDISRVEISVKDIVNEVA